MSTDRFDDPPKKKSSALPIILIVLGVCFVLCAGVCGVGGYFYYKAVKDLITQPEEFIIKVRAGDYNGAYGMTSVGYQGKHTLEDFTQAMKGAKLDKSTGSVDQAGVAQNGNNMTMTVNVQLVGNETTSVTFKLAQAGTISFKIDEITGPTIVYPGDPKKDAPNVGGKPAPKPADPDDDK